MFNYTYTLGEGRINQQDECSTFCLWGEREGSDHHHRFLQGEVAVLPAIPVHPNEGNFVAQIPTVEVREAASPVVPPGASLGVSTAKNHAIIVPVFCSEERLVFITERVTRCP